MPRWLTLVRLRLRSVLFPGRVERELQDELRFHMEREIDEHVASGLDAEEARMAARRALGPVDASMEACRDARGTRILEQGLRDLRFALRQLSAHRGFAAAAILVLALGLAAHVSMFAFVEAALLEPLPYPDSSRVVTMFGTRPADAGVLVRGSVSYLDFLDWRARSRTFASMAAYDVRSGFILSTADGPERVSGLRITAGFFRTLGVRPGLGREFTRLDEQRSAAPAVMLAYGAWQSRFGGRADVIGDSVTLQPPWGGIAEPHVIVGVLPEDFSFGMAEPADFFVAIRGAQACWEVRACRSLEAIGRLRGGITPQQAGAALTAVIDGLRTDYPGDHPDPEVANVIGLRDVLLGDIRPVLLMLLAGAALLLLIAWINVLSLLLARSDSRRRETAVRYALGASTSRLALQFGAEALVLVLAGAGTGIVLAAWLLRFLPGLVTPQMADHLPFLHGIGMNARVVAYACIIALVGATGFALAPLASIPTATRRSGLSNAGRGLAGTTWRRVGGPLVVAELAVTAVLLVGAGLLGKSLYRILHVDVGFPVERLATLSVSPVRPPSGAELHDAALEQAGQGALAREIAARLAGVQGVRAVGYADQLPLGPGLAPSSRFWVIGRPTEAQLKEDWPVRRVGAGYFRALGAVLLRGRDFSPAEVESSRHVLIVNQTAAARYFPDGDAVGQRVAFGGPSSPPREIVGVVADIKDGPPESPRMPAAYVPFDESAFTLVVRTVDPARALLPTLVTLARDARPGLLVRDGGMMSDRLRGLPSTSLRRSFTWLVGAFAALALVLSVLGLYGVVAYSVGLRQREIGVRMALGAHRGSVYRLVLREAATIVAIGTACGLALAVAAASLIRGLMFGVSSWDSPTLAAVSIVLAAAALLASYVPARRAASLNPVEVLRDE